MMGEDKLRIIVTTRAFDYLAEVEGRADLWESGDTPIEATIALIRRIPRSPGRTPFFAVELVVMGDAAPDEPRVGVTPMPDDDIDDDDQDEDEDEDEDEGQEDDGEGDGPAEVELLYGELDRPEEDARCPECGSVDVERMLVFALCRCGRCGYCFASEGR